MKHFASPRFWTYLDALPQPVRETAEKNFEPLKVNYRHPSLRFRKVGQYYSVRVGLTHRALGVGVPEGVLWFWVGSHADYDALVKRK